MLGGKKRLNGQIVDRSPLKLVGRPPKDKRKSNFKLKKLREKVRFNQASLLYSPEKWMQVMIKEKKNHLSPTLSKSTWKQTKETNSIISDLLMMECYF